MKEPIDELKKALKDKDITQEKKDYINNQLLPWAIKWLKGGVSTQDADTDHPPPPPPHH